MKKYPVSMRRIRGIRGIRWWSCAGLLMLAACGGGGGGDPAKPSPDVPGGVIVEAPTQEVPPATLARDQVVFNSNRSGNHEIYVMRADGSDIRRLTQDSGYDNWWARISPDRRRILFYRQAAGQPLQYYEMASLWVMNADGTGLTLLRDRGADGWEFQGHAEWSPDGQRILMVGGSKADKQLYLTDALGRAPQRLTHRPGLAFDPSWSPDGRLVLFSGCPTAPCLESDPSRYEIYATQPIVGAEEVRLTDDLLADFDPYFSPDGRYVAWLSTDPRIPPEGLPPMGAPWGIKVADSQTNTVRWLLDDGEVNSKPAWSLDGQSLYFHRLLSDGSRHWGIYRINLDGSGLTAVLDGTVADEEFPSN